MSPRLHIPLISALVFGLMWCSSSYAQEKASLYPTIKDLDKEIKHSSHYQDIKEQRIAGKKRHLETQSDRDSLFWACADLFNEYAFYQVDSALTYSMNMLEYSKSSSDPYVKCLARLNVVEEYIQEGMYVEAMTSLNEIRRSDVPDALLESYYYKYNALYEALCDYSLDLEKKHEYYEKEFIYKDSVYLVNPDNKYIASSILYSEGQTEKALRLLLDSYEKLSPDDRSIGPMAYAISLYYKGSGKREEEKRYLIASSISDIRCSVKEYLSLRRLSEILYEEGDVIRSHRYIEKCLADARFSNARLREIQVSQILPLFEAAFQKKLHRQVILLSGAVALILALLAICYIFLRQKKQKQKALDVANSKLAESSAIKNVFIFNLLLECVNRVDQLDTYRRFLNKKALSGDKAGVFSELKSVSFVEEQRQSFYATFDDIFIQIIPDFIEEVNRLMKPEHQFAMEDGSLSTELRILALIRLGISETERIASILKYSKATVYSYRSRIRLKSADPENFEKNILKIRTI